LEKYLFTDINVTAVSILLGAYLIGSISSAVLLCRLWQLPDPRLHGSFNPGATNVYRLGGKWPAIGVLIFDMCKGLIPVYLGFWLELSPIWLGVIAITACLGHMYPIFFRFRGGKGVATALGCLLPLDWGILFGILLCWLVIYRVWRYSSLAALVTVCIAPLLTYWRNPEYTYAVVMLSGLIVLQHRHNITRLIRGTEPRT
jgi:glycerol-3-phosphate acyltransferase PlsY